MHGETIKKAEASVFVLHFTQNMSLQMNLGTRVVAHTDDGGELNDCMTSEGAGNRYFTCCPPTPTPHLLTQFERNERPRSDLCPIYTCNTCHRECEI